MYEPLRVFMTAAALAALVGAVIWARFLVLLLSTATAAGTSSRSSSGSMLFIVAVQLAALGVIGDILAGTRVLQQRMLERVRRVELQLGVEPVALRARRAPRRGQRGHHRRAAGPRHRQDRGPRGTEAVSGGAPAAAVPTGNTYDKYGSTNPVVKRLMARLPLDARRALGAGGAGVDPRRRLRRGRADRTSGRSGSATGRIVGIDLDDPKLRAEWEQRERPNLEFRGGGGHAPLVRGRRVRPRHRDRGARARARARRRRSPRWRAWRARYLLVSVPREPLWRGLNMARGAYWRDLGNTPGHVNHWSKRGFVSLLSRYGTVEEARSPFPWTMLLVRL